MFKRTKVYVLSIPEKGPSFKISNSVYIVSGNKNLYLRVFSIALSTLATLVCCNYNTFYVYISRGASQSERQRYLTGVLKS